jgi:hypothetical protein
MASPNMAVKTHVFLGIELPGSGLASNATTPLAEKTINKTFS